MSKRTKVLVWLAVIALVLTACGASPTAAPAATTAPAAPIATTAPVVKPFVLGYDGVTDAWPYMAKFNKAVLKYGAAAGITVKMVKSGGNVADQLSSLDTLFVQKVDVISALFMNLDGSLPAIDAAKQAGNIPVISVLTSLRNEGNGYSKYIYVGSKNYDGGFMQGTWLAKQLPKGAGLWLMNSSAGDQQGLDRQKGLLDALTQAGRTDVKVVSNQYTNNMKDQGVTVMEDWLNTYKKIDCVVGTNDDSVLGGIEATKAAGRMKEGIIFVGLDGGDAALASIKAGEMSMSVLQDADTQAKELINVAVQIRDGVDPTTIKDVLVPFKVITPENVDEFMNK